MVGTYSMLTVGPSTIPDTRGATMPDMGTIGQRIQERRNELGFSKAELGRRVGVTRAAVWGWESGETKGLTPVNLVRAADAMRVEIRWLATGEGPKEVSGLGQDERDWIALLRRLPPSRREAARAILDPGDEYNPAPSGSGQ